MSHKGLSSKCHKPCSGLESLLVFFTAGPQCRLTFGCSCYIPLICRALTAHWPCCTCPLLSLPEFAPSCLQFAETLLHCIPRPEGLVPTPGPAASTHQKS